MMSESSEHVSKQTACQVDRTRKVNLQIRDTSKKITKKPITGSDLSNAAKKPRKCNPEQDKQTTPVTAKMDKVWSNLLSEKEDNTMNMRLHHSENIWTNQGAGRLFS